MFAMSVWCRKGGVGKTTISLNLCGYFASKGQSTTLVDFDPQGELSPVRLLRRRTVNLCRLK
ncbi:ParA family protein [Salmonella enterica]|uniref:ParA family protein n=1 Tax=Salmonella enterica TaxID=28901 RepID=UPI0039E75A22